VQPLKVREQVLGLERGRVLGRVQPPVLEQVRVQQRQQPNRLARQAQLHLDEDQKPHRQWQSNYHNRHSPIAAGYDHRQVYHALEMR
jgi:hypothetical protein